MIFSHSSDAILVVEDSGRIRMANRAAHELRGIELERLFTWAGPGGPDLTSFRAQLRAGGRASTELRVPEDGAGERHLALEGTAHGSDYVVVLRDVTDRRRMEEELRHLRRLEDLGHLTASVVHDFNNLLTAILCSAALLGREVAGNEGASGLARDIRSAAERAAGLTRQVLSFLRRHRSKPERVNLSAAVEEMRPLLQLVLGAHVDLSLDVDPELGDVIVEREQLDHVLVNLAVNARDAMPSGGHVTIATSKVPVADAPCPQYPPAPVVAYVALTVRDDGDGMAPEIRERVFERFYTSKDAGEGTGLGLATAHRFVKRSGGCISLHSAVGQGTTVVVYLPRAARATQVIPMVRADVARAGAETLVIIEADDHVRGALRAVLRDRGYRVVDAPSGELALRQAELAGSQIALVLADVASPGLDARLVVERLRREGQRPKLLWMSGDTDRQLVERGALGAPLLRKAFTPAELTRRIRELLDATDEAPATANGC